MRQNHLNRRAPRSDAARQWRTSLRNKLTSGLGQALSRTLDELSAQLVSGWALLLDDAGRPTPYPPAERSRDASPALSNLSELHEVAVGDPTDEALRYAARHDIIYAAPAGLTAKVRSQLPAGPPPAGNLAPSVFNPYDILKGHAHLVIGIPSFLALLAFGTSWLIAAAVPSLAFAVLATLVSLGLLLAEGLRVVWQTTAAAASNPVLVLLAMSAPLAVFLVACTQLARTAHVSRIRLA